VCENRQDGRNCRSWDWEGRCRGRWCRLREGGGILGKEMMRRGPWLDLWTGQNSGDGSEWE